MWTVSLERDAKSFTLSTTGAINAHDVIALGRQSRQTTACDWLTTCEEQVVDTHTHTHIHVLTRQTLVTFVRRTWLVNDVTTWPTDKQFPLSRKQSVVRSMTASPSLQQTVSCMVIALLVIIVRDFDLQQITVGTLVCLFSLSLSLSLFAFSVFHCLCMMCT